MTAEEKLAAAFAAAIKGKLPPEAAKAAAAGQRVRVVVRLATASEKSQREQLAAATAQGQILRTLAAGGYRPAAKETGEPSILAGWNNLAGGAK